MTIYDREMKTSKITTDKGQYSLYCQASLNSDGCITLRNYNMDNKDSDEIIVLKPEETQAIIQLFRQLGEVFSKNTPLPF